MDHDSHRGEIYDYLLEELDGARSAFFGLMSFALALAGFMLVGIQLASALIVVYAAASAVALTLLAQKYTRYEATIKAKLKEYLKQPEKYDLQLALKEVWDVEIVLRRFRVHKKTVPPAP